MKVRNGFVANSSSSSFVVSLPAIPKTAKQLQEMLFNRERDVSISDELTIDSYTVAKHVFAHLKGARPNDLVDVEDMIGELVYQKEMLKKDSPYNVAHLEKLPQIEQDAIWKSFQEKCEALTKKKFAAWLKENAKAYTYVLTFDDQGGNGPSAFIEYGIEGGNIFTNVPNIKINNH